MSPALCNVVTPPARRAAYLATGAWDQTHIVTRIREHGDSRSSRIAIVDLDGHRETTFGELVCRMNQFAHLLLQLGVRPGDVVSVQLPNWLEAIIADLAVWSVGAVLNPMLPNYGTRDVQNMLRVGRVRVLVTPDRYRGIDFQSRVGVDTAACPSFEHHIVVPNPNDGRQPLVAQLDDQPSDEPQVDLDPSAVSLLVFTSGTESLPKAVMHTEQTLNCATRDDYICLGMTDSDVVWMPAPIGHLTGLGRGMRVGAYHGLTVVMQDRWDPVLAAELIQHYHCSFTTAAATFAYDLIKAAQTEVTDLSSMRLFMSGGATVPPVLVRAATELGISILRQYGSTELRTVTANRLTSPDFKRESTDGRALPYVELEVRDDSGSAVVGEAGDIYARGPATSVGLFDDPERTSAIYDEDGWVRSGDVGLLDADGYLTIVGRSKDIIIRGGMNIAPRELEDLILQHPSVERVAVLGLPDDRLGEIVGACVVLASNAPLLDLPDLSQHLTMAGVAKFKLPQELRIVKSLPTNASGKVRKPELAKHFLSSPPATM
jgi:cyclohexanecarboxylate-CoA ligase